MAFSLSVMSGSTTRPLNSTTSRCMKSKYWLWDNFFTMAPLVVDGSRLSHTPPLPLIGSPIRGSNKKPRFTYCKNMSKKYVFFLIGHLTHISKWRFRLDFNPFVTRKIRQTQYSSGFVWVTHKSCG